MRFEMFEGKVADPDKLKEYGFCKIGEDEVYNTEILDGKFQLTVSLSTDGEIHTHVRDLASDDPYTLHLVEGVTGAFVGAVRADFLRVLNDIADNCFSSGIFGGASAQAVIGYAKTAFGDSLEFLWEGFPQDAVLRRKDSGKWYALFVRLKREKLWTGGKGEVDIAVMRALPESIPAAIDGKHILPAYHMNKKSWLTAVLDDDADVKKICEMLCQSYELAKK